jgi:hypothetical protein
LRYTTANSTTRSIPATPPDKAASIHNSGAIHRCLSGVGAVRSS